MEKYIFILPFVLVVFVNLSAVAAFKPPPFVEECKAAERATDDDIKSMMNPNQPKTTVQKCFLTCVGEKTGKIVNNKLNPEGVLNFVKTMPKYSADMESKVREVVEECKDVQDADRCESGAKIMECMKEGAKKRGLMPDFHGERQS